MVGRNWFYLTTLLFALLRFLYLFPSFSLSFPIPCPFGDLHSEITSVKESMEGREFLVVVGEMSGFCLYYNEGHRTCNLIWSTDIGIYFFETLFISLSPLCLVLRLGHILGKIFPSPLSSPSFYNCFLPHSWNISVPTIPFYRQENNTQKRIKLSTFLQQLNGRAKTRIL